MRTHRFLTCVLVTAVCVSEGLAYAQFDGDATIDEMDQASALIAGHVSSATELLRAMADRIQRDAIPSASRGLTVTAEQAAVSLGAEVRSTLAFLLAGGSRDEPEGLEVVRKAIVSSIAPHAIDLTISNESSVARSGLPSTLLIGGYGFMTKDINGSKKQFHAIVYGEKRPAGEDVSNALRVTSPMTMQINLSEIGGVAFLERDERIDVSLDDTVIATIPITWTAERLEAGRERELSLELYTGKDDKDDSLYFSYQVSKDGLVIASDQNVGKGETWNTGETKSIKAQLKGRLLPGVYRVDIYAYGDSEWDARVRVVAKTLPGVMPEAMEESIIFDRHFQPESNNTARKHLLGFWRW